MTDETGAGKTPSAASSPRAPSLVDALIPLVTLIGLIVLTIALFGTDATSGPLQVALLTSALVAGLVAFKNGYSASRIREAAIGGVSSGMSALFILLAVGALIGTWNMAGTIPTVVYYGLGLLSVTWFYPATAIVCGVVGLAIGSSWTTAATLGVAFVALAPLVGADPAIAAGAVISGAYFGDKMTPVSETTVLVPSMVGGVTTNEHIGAMIWTSGPAVVIAIILFAILGLMTPATGAEFDTAGAQAILAGEFSIGLVNLLPMVLLVIFSVRRVPPFLAIFSSALFAGILASFTQPELVAAFVDKPGQGPVLTGIEAIYAAMANGFVSATGNETIDTLFSRGGMSGMLTTIWLILGALSYAAIMEDAGFLDRLIRPIVARATSTGRLIAAVIGTCIGLNIIAGDQYVAIVMPSRVYRAEFARRGIAPRMLSRAVEDSGTVTSPLVPWNSCGAYMAAALGVTTIAYLPFCFFNLASPIISLLYGFTGFRIERDPADRRAARLHTGHRPDGIAQLGGRPRMTAATTTPATERRPSRLRAAVGVHDPVHPHRLTAFATYIIPAGVYDVDATASRSRARYHQVEQNPQRIVVDSLMAPINGLYGIEGEDGSISVWNSGELFGAIDVALFILVIGGFLGVTMKTGAIQGGISRIVARLKGRERLMIPILMIVFAIGGSTFGMAEESLAFYALIITVMIAAGYDSLVAASILLLGCGIGVLGSTINPFATGIASGFAGVSIEEGIVGRLIILIVGTAIGIVFVMRYAARVKADPGTVARGRPAGGERGAVPHRLPATATPDCIADRRPEGVPWSCSSSPSSS